MQTFMEVGMALATIRDKRLYQAKYATFEDYCHQRWSLSRSRAYQLMAAADVVSTIVDTGLPAPANEGQARELARVPAEKRAEVWRATVERTEGKPTAAAIRGTYTAVRPAPGPQVPGQMDVYELTTLERIPAHGQRQDLCRRPRPVKINKCPRSDR